jgi:predicted HicB family RNase H-like nuclease
VPRKKRDPLEKFVLFRVSARDYNRLRRVAEQDHLSVSTWVRQLMLKALDRVETPVRAVAERRTTGKDR